MGSENQRVFDVRVEEGREDSGSAGAASISVRVSQRIRKSQSTRMWNSVTVYGSQEQDGTLMLRVLVFNPDWDSPLQIACIRSRPEDQECLTPLGCNLDHIAT